MNLSRLLWIAPFLALGCSTSGGNPDGGPDAGPQLPTFPATANSISVTDGAGRSDPEGVAPASTGTHVVTWKDSRGADRTLTLDAYLYEYRYSFVGAVSADPAQVTTRTADDDAYGHAGFGYIVSHASNGNSPLGKGNAPTLVSTRVSGGAHHAVHHVELMYRRDQEGGGDGIQIPVVIEWFVATGRDHPVWAVTYEMGKVINPGNDDFNDYRMDTRAPYGSLNWDGQSKVDGDIIGGVAWGDFALRFRTTDASLTLNSSWTYNVVNTVNYVQAWTNGLNAEMGIVQTAAGDKTMGYPDRVVPSERGSTSGGAYPNKQNCADFGDAMRHYSVPCVDGWPYQLMNYDWDPTSGKSPADQTSTKLLGWGSPYGFLGATDADLFDLSGTYSATGDRSYATFIVLGPKCRYATAGGACNQPGDVDLTLATVDALTSATISAVGPGALVTQAPTGPGATQTKTLSNGYNDTFGVYWLTAQNQHLTFNFAAAAGKPVDRPIFHIDGYTGSAVPTVSVDGAAVSVNGGDATSGAFASLDANSHVLWVTLNRKVSASTQIAVSAP